jgi:hypothetical protein
MRLNVFEVALLKLSKKINILVLSKFYFLVAVMLVPQTKELNEKSFVNILQHGGNDFTCN